MFSRFAKRVSNNVIRGFANRIDVHNHIVPEFYFDDVEALGGDTNGWYTPKWSEKAALENMDTQGIQKAIVSVTTPGATIYSGEKARGYARKLNEYSATVSNGNPSRFGYLANLPSLEDPQGAIAEMEYAIAKLGASGVIVYTHYGPDSDPLYAGDEACADFWAAANRLKTVVLLHPLRTTEPMLKMPGGGILPPPLADFPHDTTRAAAQLVAGGTMTANPDVKVILSHAGGVLPYLNERIAYCVPSKLSPEEIQFEFKKFYYDLAQSCSREQLLALFSYADPSRILYGSDMPYCPEPFQHRNFRLLDAFMAKGHTEGPTAAMVNYENAEKLLSSSSA
eukprot:TRINITY_DN10060_c2_g1_i1.p1 TRINITY_DN10060_c2_g1~~TRINITY_DN10060_c2_g1_i1.p1  ORF type:complete len:352 (-),score=66.07 TRINITY_DN10060_c2_g1_i1:77-1090(-)